MIMVEGFYLEVKRLIEELVGDIASNIVEHHFDHSAYHLLSRALASEMIGLGERQKGTCYLLEQVSVKRSIDLRQATPLPEVIYDTEVGLYDFIDALSEEILGMMELYFVAAIGEKFEDSQFWSLLEHLLASCDLQSVISYYLLRECLIPSYPDLFNLN